MLLPYNNSFATNVASSIQNNDNNNEYVVFGAGCFWCLEAIFNDIYGIKEVLTGYSSESIKEDNIKPKNSKLNHVIRVVYDKRKITFDDIVRIFFISHDPTCIKQGNEIGKEYHPIIYYKNKKEKDIIYNHIVKIKDYTKYTNKLIITKVQAYTYFIPASDVYQSFYKKKPYNKYCYNTIKPMVIRIKSRISTISNLLHLVS